MGEYPVGHDMDGRALHQASVPVHPGSLVPPSLHGGCVDADGYRIDLLPITGKGSEINGEPRVTAVVMMHLGAVYPDSAMGTDSVDLEFQMLAVVGRVELE